MVTPFAAEKTLTKDTVPVDVDAVLFWVVWDAEKAALEVADYHAAIAWAAQTALREMAARYQPEFRFTPANNVILALASALVKQSIIAFMFNFRGVGRSQGNFGGGIDEQDDVAAALNWLMAQREVDTVRIGLAGYSFGAERKVAACAFKG
jgi:dipeptidyl aminopeptidase/acylaminoacyl peptidase